MLFPFLKSIKYSFPLSFRIKSSHLNMVYKVPHNCDTDYIFHLQNRYPLISYWSCWSSHTTLFIFPEIIQLSFPFWPLNMLVPLQWIRFLAIFSRPTTHPLKFNLYVISRRFPWPCLLCLCLPHCASLIGLRLGFSPLSFHRTQFFTFIIALFTLQYKCLLNCFSHLTIDSMKTRTVSIMFTTIFSVFNPYGTQLMFIDWMNEWKQECKDTYARKNTQEVS